MAIVNCRDCGETVSTEAPTCPHCGIPSPGSLPLRRKRSTPKSIVIFASVLFLIYGAAASISFLSPEAQKKPDAPPAKDTILDRLLKADVAPVPAPKAPPPPEKTAEEKARELQAKKAEDERCARELKCYAEKNLVRVSVVCDSMVERLAKNDFEWTSGWFGLKFSNYKWRNQKGQVVTYIGDKIKFQNGFGAWINHIYECDFDGKKDRIGDVRASPGRLSAD